MKSSKSRKYQEKFYEKQYISGETKGPGWYQALKSFTTNREQVAFQLFQEHVPLKNLTIVDLGCGEGNLISLINNSENKIIGLDVAKNRLSIAQRKNKSKNVSFQKHDLNEKLPFSDQTIDVVFAISVMEYIFDPYFLVKEIKRILKPNGVLILEVPNIAFFPERIRLLFGYLPSWPDAAGWQGGRLHAFTQNSISELLKAEGFEVSKFSGVGFLLFLKNYWPSLLSGELVVVAKKLFN